MAKQKRSRETKRAGQIMGEQSGKLIGKRKYEALKALELNDPTEDSIIALELQFPNLTVADALKMISDYEKHISFNSIENNKSVQDYFKEINTPKEMPQPKEMTKEWLWKQFVFFFYRITGKKFIQNDETLENIKPLIYYFIGDFDEFKKCKNVSPLSEPSLSKGLLIIGDYGSGKTSVMQALEKSLQKTNVSFKRYTAHQIVDLYDAMKDEYDRENFENKTQAGTRHFDDLLTEKVASNYGKVDIFQLILEKRYDNNARTYITMNFDDEFPKDIEKGLDQLARRYGNRVYDRIFAMFNIVVFKGKSFRK